jgi:pSer/pThr/pTyr-binding forkhead associated (FHA) protein
VFEDLCSLNGTFVNGRRLSAPTAMQDNDALSFGEVQAFFLKVATLRRRMGHRFPSVATP